MLRSISNFANDGVGVEKSLKFLRSTSQIAANIGYWSAPEAALWTTARNQFNLARRFFRLFKWIDCWNNAYSQYEAYNAPTVTTEASKKNGNPGKTAPAQDSFHFLLLILKWSLLGAYLFLEFFTTADAVLGTWRPWAVTLQIESLKFWFYALSVSVVLDLYEIFLVFPALVESTQASGKPVADEKKALDGTGKKSGGDGKADRNTAATPNPVSVRAAKRAALYRQLVIDSCDALIPGAAVGWLNLDPVTVGLAGTISALVGGSDAWRRVNA